MHRIVTRLGVTTLFVLSCAFTAMIGCDRGSSTATTQGSGTSGGGERVKIGFIVKDPTEPWFQNEWKFAQQAADEKGFDLVKIGATDGNQAMAAIDNLAAQGAKGLVICTPDTKLGPALKAKADENGLKLLSVDDQFMDADGKPMADVHHVGISARNIGKSVGAALAEQMKARGWAVEDTGLCVVSFDELETARERTEGATEALLATGFPKARVFRTPQKTNDVPGAFSAVDVLLTQHPKIKNWLICGLNDNAVLGAVRAMEQRQVKPANVIGIGINGTDCLDEFRKPEPTGFYGSILLTPRRHGYETAVMMQKWIAESTEPPKITFTDGILITRDTYEKIMKEQGLL
jgi:L-arabinose transport system substrate-binding protein